ncbi:toll/interleukin-1 receptor domain-containing protein [Marinifilum sp.]|uniref:toll/interleukin-1 receptor domain-containing protein n=1 Tax=Marinifilum sp. TaxID=2033137 RepID=UPI003BACDB79
MSKIFISYRRSETREFAVRIYDRLVLEFGKDNVFLDVEDIEPGIIFPKELEKALNDSRIMLVIIGNNWLSLKDKNGNAKIFNPEDFVFQEIKMAINNGVKIIPVLVNGSKIPDKLELPEQINQLSHRNAIEIKNDSFHMDIDRLVEKLRGPNYLLLGVLIFISVFIGRIIFMFFRETMTSSSEEAVINMLDTQNIIHGLRWLLISLAVLTGIKKSFGIRFEQIISTSALIALGVILGYSINTLLKMSDNTLYSVLKEGIKYSFISFGLLLGLKKRISISWKNIILVFGSVFFSGLISALISSYALKPVLQNLDIIIVNRIVRHIPLLIVALLTMILSKKYFKMNRVQILNMSIYIFLGVITSAILIDLGNLALSKNIMRWGLTSSFYYTPIILSIFMGVFKLNEKRKNINPSA